MLHNNKVLLVRWEMCVCVCVLRQGTQFVLPPIKVIDFWLVGGQRWHLVHIGGHLPISLQGCLQLHLKLRLTTSVNVMLIHNGLLIFLLFCRIKVMTWPRLFLSGRRCCCAITYWTDCSPSPSSLLVSLLWGIRLVTQPLWIRVVCRMVVCYCWPVTSSKIMMHSITLIKISSTALSSWCWIVAKVFRLLFFLNSISKRIF